MVSKSEFAGERAELDSVLNSGIFSRAPNLALVLSYVCSKYFEHKTSEIKEYNIAVEALDRPADFDPRADAIVRVEAHRLRKRLKDFYRTQGADHAVQIEIPRGQYAPRFLILEKPTELAIVAPPPVEPSLPAVPVETPRASREWFNFTRRRWILLAAAILLCAAIPVVRMKAGHGRPLPSLEPPTLKPGEPIRIACGLESDAYIDQSGNTWSSDRFFQGGTAVRDHDLHLIRGTRDPGLYRQRREGAFRYDIPLSPGVFELRLHFAETVYGPGNAGGGGESSRVFSIAINGVETLPQFDVVADRDAATADVRAFKDVLPAADGRLHLQFAPVSNMPILNGIEIIPGVRGRMRPIRMVARDRGYIDKQGRSWEPDRYASGGQLIVRNEAISGAADADLFRGERYGNFSYIVPVAAGKYRVRLYFAETWFGPDKAGRGTGVGSRVFDILCNGVAVRRNFDIFKDAGGSNRAVTVDIPGVIPDHQGKIVISLPPAQNYACLNAIEILDES